MQLSQAAVSSVSLVSSLDMPLCMYDTYDTLYSIRYRGIYTIYKRVTGYRERGSDSILSGKSYPPFLA